MEKGRDVRRIIEHPRREDDIEVVLQEHVLLPGLPFLELDLDVHADVLEVVLERQHHALHGLALLFDRDLERERQPLAVLLHEATRRSRISRRGWGWFGIPSP